MYYYLQITNTVFIDPHGTPDDGGTVKEVIESKWKIDTEKEYLTNYLDPSYEEITEESYNDFEEETGCSYNDYEPSGAEDGYNAQYDYASYKEITHDQFLIMGEIINNYNNL